ncbi:pimeloyl-ACP methyl ester carboxylesterase [Rhizobium lentis]|uniref:Pimeloyl-ACP methyl ester carboxylesterase n=2 Tax=Rhizobium lentis TaxID=1138194 RepID=A0A7W8XJQ5_9HYPH|nr:pimeloyl-ACP methyl ester carboxylesterase [Rhizobium lentis]MBB5553486.1 pimeloyl-ACP methyl ester carboxylesterase [Rhizobium lentis]MBB5564122.1 pimeloyl-ACP methyl ester carboxylesterase [Rhizobium lentis]MBB5570534.1 pimeloyl-ACP methyl ester carboxylesterase [Rhizobium lentis]
MSVDDVLNHMLSVACPIGAGTFAGLPGLLPMLKKQLIQPRLGTISVIDDQQVHVLESGSTNGSPVVVLHGCGSLAQEVLLPIENSKHRLIAVDRPGYGLSSPLPPPERGPLGQSFWLERFIETAGVGPVTIVAHSIGSASALHLAARRPELLKALLLLSPCCSPVPPEPLILLRAAVAPLIGPAIRRHIMPRWASFFLRHGLRSSSFPNALPSHLSMLPAGHMIRASAIETMADELRAFNRDMVLLAGLPEQLPVHVLFGSQDLVVDPDRHIGWLRQRHPGLLVKCLEGVGHLPHHIAPTVVLRMLNAIIEERSSLPEAEPATLTDVA